LINLIPAWVNGELNPVEKLSAHRQGLRHKAVSVFLLAGSRVLLQKRADLKYHTPGLWSNTCCTHPDWDETPEYCALRRLDEELGITGVPLTFRHQVEYRADVGSGMVENEVVDIFVGHVAADLVITPNLQEVSDTDWVDLHDLADATLRNPAEYTPWLGIYLEMYQGAIFAEAS